MKRSLTVLLPVRDAQSTLVDTVTQVLELASDMTDHFELLIIDDASSDATSEVAHELTRHYPQVRIFRHSRPLGRDVALQTGLAQSRGEVVLVPDTDRSDPQAGQGKSAARTAPTSGGLRQRFHRISKPGRPNYLGRLRHFAREQW